MEIIWILNSRSAASSCNTSVVYFSSALLRSSSDFAFLYLVLSSDFAVQRSCAIWYFVFSSTLLAEWLRFLSLSSLGLPGSISLAKIVPKFRETKSVITYLHFIKTSKINFLNKFNCNLNNQLA